MKTFASLTAAALALFGGVSADLTNSGFIPEEIRNGDANSISVQTADCNNLAFRLNRGDCDYLNQIGFSDQGWNARGPGSQGAWIGNDGPYTFTFTNHADQPGPVATIFVLWLMNGPRDYVASFVNARRPIITVSLPNQGDSVTISLAEGQIGAFTSLNNHVTYLTQYGQVSNTWGEFNTKRVGNTFDVTKEVDMNGNLMDIRANNGCVANSDTCVFKCINGARSCGNAGEYQIFNCGPPNPGAQHSPDGMNGGCSGWGNNGNGHLDVSLRRY